MVVYQRDSVTAWIETARLDDDLTPSNGRFGESLDIHDDLIVVGIPAADAWLYVKHRLLQHSRQRLSATQRLQNTLSVASQVRSGLVMLAHQAPCLFQRVTLPS